MKDDRCTSNGTLTKIKCTSNHKLSFKYSEVVWISYGYRHLFSIFNNWEISNAVVVLVIPQDRSSEHVVSQPIKPINDENYLKESKMQYS